MRRRLPGRLASLAALLRSMPTARGQGSKALVRFEADGFIKGPPADLPQALL